MCQKKSTEEITPLLTELADLPLVERFPFFGFLYHALNHDGEAVRAAEASAAEYEAQQCEQAVAALRKKARHLGLEVVGPNGEVGTATAPE